MVLRGAVRERGALPFAGAGRRSRSLALAVATLLSTTLLTPALAQGPNATAPGAAQRTGPAVNLVSGVRTNPDAKMLVQAEEMVYDYENERVSAVGKVQIYYDGSVLEADRVTHDRRTNRLRAEGNVRYQTKDGKIIHTQAIELDADFREGFIQSLLVETPDRTFIAAARAQRSDGNITVLESGAYTACVSCRDNPERPPLWQVKAARIIHNERERVVHYEDASFEFFGMPIARLPYFWHPDPTVKRQTGFLTPEWFSSSRVGVGVAIPYYWALAPNYDFTLTVAPMTRQIGPLVSGEWRHRLVNGSYAIRASGIFQQDKEAFLDSGRTPGYRDFRGSVETKGDFSINNRWKWGWDGALFTDRFYAKDYSFATDSSGTEKTSQVYLTGQGSRSYFDARMMHFTGFSRLDNNGQLPIIHPVIDHNYIFDRPVMGGELGLRSNFTSLSRRNADFDPTISTNVNKCITAPDPNECLLRGMSGAVALV
jgi:LPS-assembly protein